jgi:hypothetical protein
VVIIALGFFAGFQQNSSNRYVGGTIMGTSALAAILSILGIQAAHDTNHWQQHQQTADVAAQQIDQAVLAAIQVQDQSGFYITMLSLAIAGGVGFILFNDLLGSAAGDVRSIGSLLNPLISDPVQQVQPTLTPPVATPQGSYTGANTGPDTAFWDSVNDKNDVDHLEEYLIRFPHGRFAQLARNRLERKAAAGPAHVDVEAISLPIAIEAKPTVQPAETWCAACRVALEPDSKFCADCGEPVQA